MIVRTLQLAIVLHCFLLPLSTDAADYYVAVNGSDSNPGTEGQPWQTIGMANRMLQPGDTVYIRSGVYTGQQIRPVVSGTAERRIVYRNADGETAIITQSEDPLYLSDRSYITIHGITVRQCDKYFSMANGHYNHLEYLSVDSMRHYTRFEGFQIGPNASYNWMHHCTISRYGEYSGEQDSGDMVYVGDNPDPGDTHHNLVEDNHMFYGGHNVFSVNGHYNVIRNNYLHNEIWSKGYGNRITSLRADDGSGKWNLFEGNRFAFAAVPNDIRYSKGIQGTTNNCMFRRNFFYANSGPGLHIVTNSKFPSPLANNNYIYHNVFYHNGMEIYPGQLYIQGRTNIDGSVIKNNIFGENTYGTIRMSDSVTNTLSAGNLESGDPRFKNARVDALAPSKPAYPDFHLLPDSPAIDAGVFLTTTTAAGRGTVIPVADAHYFMDGWGIIESDVIQLEGENQTARITTVDYEVNTVTVDRTLTWTSGLGVSLSYNGLKPDVGAYEWSEGTENRD